MRKSTLAAMAVVTSLWTAEARAGQATANLTVQATVADACSTTDATLSFGTVLPSAGTAAPVSSTINVTCTLGTSFSVGLGTGLNLSGGARRMRQGATTTYLNYELYKDAAAVTRFGDTGASDRATGVGVGLLATAIQVYGAIPSGQNVGTGAYADTVQINVYY